MRRYGSREMYQDKLLTRPQLAKFLSESGFPISYSTLTKYCSPGISIGPPVEAYWGSRPMHSPVRALEWAKARLRRCSSSLKTQSLRSNKEEN